MLNYLIGKPNIEKAVRDAGLCPVSLSDGALIDIGGLIFLDEA